MPHKRSVKSLCEFPVSSEAQLLKVDCAMQDFIALHLKTKRHYNSFTTAFFLDLKDVLHQLQAKGCLEIDKDAAEVLLKNSLQCHHTGCSYSPKTLPALKQHLAEHQQS